ncbi:MAG: protoporphyrinogen oxidase HemJ [Oscillatoria sp. Prado101]|jgi:putative membrane protein|nr:protoporphyrinogen oxidase HemJ [Oscillatoria sp. Prado101]
MAYLWFKAFHIIGIVVWFAGLFYLVRLFVYHVEAEEKPEPARQILKEQYQLMEKRLYNLITTPGMVLSVSMAIALLVTSPQLLQDAWLQFKLALVAVLIAYHFYCGWVMKQLAAEKFSWSSQQMRGLNEVPTVLLLAIVLLAVFKNTLPVSAAIWALVGMTGALAVFFQLYARHRRKQALIEVRD